MHPVTVLEAPPPLRDLREGGPVALFLDFDGTLVHIADHPERIMPPEQLADRLAGLAERLHGRLALVSGRAISNIEHHIGPLSIARAGSHGVSRLLADGSRLGEEPEGLPEGAMQALADFAAARGLDLETKLHGVALHYRSNPSLGEAGLEFAQELAAAEGLSVKQGKFVIELVRPGADKAEAVRAFMAEAPFAGAMPVFVGDDITDEDGFTAAGEFGGYGILVGDRTPSRARYGLADPDAVIEWLGL